MVIQKLLSSSGLLCGGAQNPGLRVSEADQERALRQARETGGKPLSRARPMLL